MVYSGADLLRTSGQQQTRVAQLKVAPGVKPVNASGKSKSSLDQDAQSAFLRLARFVKDRKPSQKKTPSSSGHPYITAEKREEAFFEIGQNIDIYV